MPVEFYCHLQNKNIAEPIFSLTIYDFDLLQDVLEAFKDKTGVILDPYGTVKINPDHSKLIAQLIGVFSLSKKSNNRLEVIKNYFEKASIDNVQLIMEGE